LAAPEGEINEPPATFRSRLVTGWVIAGIMLLMLVAVDLAAAAVLALRRDPDEPKPEDRAALLRTEDGAAWFADYLGEQEARGFDDLYRWEEFSLWRQKPWRGTLLNVDERGLRRTVGASTRPDTPRVFLFGGSTTWGFYSRDEDTIPSQLARLLVERGLEAQVQNFGEVGYISTQELLTLTRELASGRPGPDLAVFLDGLNDAEAPLFNDEQVGPTFWLQERVERFPAFFDRQTTAGALRNVVRNSALFRLMAFEREAPHPMLEPEAVERVSGQVADLYATNAAAIEGLARARGFTALLYLQPLIARKRQVSEVERAPIEPYTGDYLERNRAYFVRVCERVRARMADRPGFHAMDDLFLDEAGTRYVDGEHYTRAANEAIARRMLVEVEAALRQRLSARAP
jgi:lysophospholipase L1-like esterase